MDQSKPIVPHEKEGVKKIHRKVVGILILMVLAVPVVGLAHTLTHSDTVALLLVFIFFITIIYLWLSVVSGRCPRCGKFFFVTLTFFTFKCRNCGLRL